MPYLKEISYKNEFYFQWHLTDECNLRCRHCYHESYQNPGFDINTLFNIADRICEATAKWGKLGVISLTGGEPFLRKFDLFHLMDYIGKKSEIHYFDILTNGTLITDEDAEKLTVCQKLRR
ncbi:MAG: radical SAM protein, partial [Candidatus Wallbacteria bacterium]|nr:radical SAM protein [Candidatus Wallbacteria bacterium]